MSNTSNATYLLNTCSLDQPAAQQFCNDNGGHLVSFKSLQEQQDVEDYFVNQVRGAVEARAAATDAEHWRCQDMPLWGRCMQARSRSVPAADPTLNRTLHDAQGYLMPSFHTQYWIGLKASRPTRFSWLEPGQSAPSGQTYVHWGRNAPNGPAEPNNMAGDELCGTANFSQGYQRAAGWSDMRCNITAPSICRLSGGCGGWGRCSTAGPDPACACEHSAQPPSMITDTNLPPPAAQSPWAAA